MNRMILFLITFLVASVNCFSQSSNRKSLELVQVTDWGGTFFMISDYFWNTVKDELINQIGIDGYERAKKYSKYENMPKEMCIMLNSTTKKDTNEFYAKMCSLKFYKSAVVKIPSNDKGNGGTDILLMATYKENKEWDTKAKWDTVYFLVREKFVSYTETEAKGQTK